jgi:hypothetical protein
MIERLPSSDQRDLEEERGLPRILDPAQLRRARASA